MSNIWAFAFMMVGIAWAVAFAVWAIFKYDNTAKILDTFNEDE